MPKKYGVKEKDLVVSHVVNLVLTGKLRSGDRVDRNEIAHELGLSPRADPRGRGAARARRHPVDAVPPRRVRRTIRRVRGARTPRALRDAQRHRLGARRRRWPTARSSTSSTSLIDVMRSSRESRAFQERRGSSARVINDEYAGPRLQAAIRASQTFIPRAFWVGLPQQPRRDAAVLRGRDSPPSAAATPTPPAPRARAGRDDGPDHARRVGAARRVPACRRRLADGCVLIELKAV